MSLRAPLGVWPLLAGGVVVALAIAALGDFRTAGYVLAAVLAVCAVARAVLPAWRAGELVVRSRFVDVLLLSAAATAVAVLSATIKTLP